MHDFVYPVPGIYAGYMPGTGHTPSAMQGEGTLRFLTQISFIFLPNSVGVHLPLI